jgi:hypothetical protein
VVLTRDAMTADIEDLLLERSERFWAMIARARRGKPIALEALRKEVSGPPPRGRIAASGPPSTLGTAITPK